MAKTVYTEMTLFVQFGLSKNSRLRKQQTEFKKQPLLISFFYNLYYLRCIFRRTELYFIYPMKPILKPCDSTNTLLRVSLHIPAKLTLDKAFIRF